MLLLVQDKFVAETEQHTSTLPGPWLNLRLLLKVLGDPQARWGMHSLQTLMGLHSGLSWKWLNISTQRQTGGPIVL